MQEEQEERARAEAQSSSSSPSVDMNSASSPVASIAEAGTVSASDLSDTGHNDTVLVHTPSLGVSVFGSGKSNRERTIERAAPPPSLSSIQVPVKTKPNM